MVSYWLKLIGTTKQHCPENYFCCDRRAALEPCDCTAGLVCLNCKRCERHCRCPFDLRELVVRDDDDTAIEPTQIIQAGT